MVMWESLMWLLIQSHVSWDSMVRRSQSCERTGFHEMEQEVQNPRGQKLCELEYFQRNVAVTQRMKGGVSLESVWGSLTY